MHRSRPRIGLLAFVLGAAAVLAAAAAVRADARPSAPRAEPRPASVLASRPRQAAQAGAHGRRVMPLGLRATRVARRYLGVPYRWGGASPTGFDCSGLVSYVYGRLGVPLPHNAAALFGVGRSVPVSRVRAGDLVFFSGLGHVGLALGRGRYIHAPQSGRSVEIGLLAERRGSIVGARRVA